MTPHRLLGRLLAGAGVLVALVLGLAHGPAAGATATAAAASASSAAVPVESAPAESAPSAIPGAASSWTAGGLIESTGPLQQEVTQSPGFAQVGACTFYASNSSAGGFCSTGGTAIGRASSLAEWLNGKKFYACRYFDVPDGMYVAGGQQDEDGKWMLKACFQDYDLSQPWGGRDTHVEIFTQWVPKGEWDQIKLPRYMETFWDVQADRNYYPIPRLVVEPYPTAKVNTYTFFHAIWVEALDSEEETEPRYTIAYDTQTQGTALLHAEIGNITLHPGLKEMEEKRCGRADVPFDQDASDAIPEEEGGDQESTCWLKYEHSTAYKDSGTVQLRATAEWRVWVERSDGSTIDLGTFRYELDQRLAVAEVQPQVEFLEDE